MRFTNSAEEDAGRPADHIGRAARAERPASPPGPSSSTRSGVAGSARPQPSRRTEAHGSPATRRGAAGRCRRLRPRARVGRRARAPSLHQPGGHEGGRAHAEPPRHPRHGIEGGEDLRLPLRRTVPPLQHRRAVEPAPREDAREGEVLTGGEAGHHLEEGPTAGADLDRGVVGVGQVRDRVADVPEGRRRPEPCLAVEGGDAGRSDSSSAASRRAGRRRRPRPRRRRSRRRLGPSTPPAPRAPSGRPSDTGWAGCAPGSPGRATVAAPGRRAGVR